MVVKITLTTAGTDTGPFNIFSNSDNYAVAVATNVAKSALLSGYDATVPNNATIVRVTSTGTCTNFINIPITVTYVMILGTDYDFDVVPSPNPSGIIPSQTACGGSTSPTKQVTYVGNLAPGTQLNGLVYSGDVGFMKIISSTEPGFTYVGKVINCINGLDTVYQITTCP
jgi:hypothetical protein